jgi:hypothetical protein
MKRALEMQLKSAEKYGVTTNCALSEMRMTTTSA